MTRVLDDGTIMIWFRLGPDRKISWTIEEYLMLRGISATESAAQEAEWDLARIEDLTDQDRRELEHHSTRQDMDEKMAAQMAAAGAAAANGGTVVQKLFKPLKPGWKNG